MHTYIYVYIKHIYINMLTIYIFTYVNFDFDTFAQSTNTMMAHYHEDVSQKVLGLCEHIKVLTGPSNTHAHGYREESQRGRLGH